MATRKNIGNPPNVNFFTSLEEDNSESTTVDKMNSSEDLAEKIRRHAKIDNDGTGGILSKFLISCIVDFSLDKNMLEMS